MDYEKKYKDALERARVWKEKSGMPKDKQGILDDIFPELKESEDEKIRKSILELVKQSSEILDKQNQNNMIAWLEKQGEQKVPINDFNSKDWYVSEVDGKIHDMTYNPTDKVEPKFKVGDWIVNNEDGSIGQIKKIVYDESCYGYDHTNGWFHSVFEKDYHLWTIDDAKDGDVLVDSLSGDNQITILFKCIGLDTFIRAYCGWNHYNFRVTTDGIGYGTLSSTKYVPATKEQRNLLFQKMKKAGYWWDVDKKKLKLLISNGSDFESDDSEQESKEEIKTTAYGTFGNNGAIEYVYILDYCSGRVIVAKRDTEESIETLFDKLGLKESQSQYMVSTDILSIEYINF